MPHPRAVAGAAALVALAFAAAPASAEQAIIINPIFDVQSVPLGDGWFGLGADIEAVPADGRYGWYLHADRLAEFREEGGGDIALAAVDGEPVSGTVEEEEAPNRFLWLWLTPDAPLAPETEYQFEVTGSLGAAFDTFTTGAEELTSVAPATPSDLSLRVTWRPQRPNSEPTIGFEVSGGLDRTADGSARLSVLRVSTAGEIDRVFPVGSERSAFGFWDQVQERGTERPDEVCVTFVHENGDGERSDPEEVCEVPQLASGCSVASGSPAPLAALLLLAAARLSRPRRRPPAG
ncbi:MAG: hypothetical protein GY898_19655 [Proteobacteria bacterium]|nr:hypothetical protein [Pseudomonadota bacterium]